MKQFKKILAILLVVSLGTVVACGDDRGTDNNAAGTDTGQTQNDTGNTDTGNTDAGQTQNDTGNTDAGQTQNDTGNTNTDSTAQLKDLTPAEVAAVCQKMTKKQSDFYNPATETGKAFCLLDSAVNAFDDEFSDEENIGFCDELLDDCLAEPVEGPSDECMTPTGCSATVAEFEKCNDDILKSDQTLLKPFSTKTCGDTATEAAIDSASDAYFGAGIPSCEILYEKCPDIDDYMFVE